MLRSQPKTRTNPALKSKPLPFGGCCFGYARVSTYGQTLDTQLEQLKVDGCSKICREKASGAQPYRRWLAALCLAFLGVSLAATAAERQVERHAAVGQTVRIRGHVNFHSCSQVIPTAIAVLEAPSRGTVSVRDETVTQTTPDLGDRCRAQSGEGKVVYYTRTSLGSDHFQYTSSSANGQVRVTVTVDCVSLPRQMGPDHQDA